MWEVSVAFRFIIRPIYFLLLYKVYEIAAYRKFCTCSSVCPYVRIFQLRLNELQWKLILRIWTRRFKIIWFYFVSVRHSPYYTQRSNYISSISTKWLAKSYKTYVQHNFGAILRIDFQLWFSNPLRLIGSKRIICFCIIKLWTLPKECVCAFHLVLKLLSSS